MRLRNLGIYVLPDGKEYVADALNAGAYALVPTGLWEVFRFADYRVNADGRLLREGAPTRWHLRHLRDTGRDAQYPAPNRPL
jgi:hypothetical protein